MVRLVKFGNICREDGGEGVFMIPAGVHDAVVCQGRQGFKFEVTSGPKRFSSGFFRDHLLPPPCWFDLKLLAPPKPTLGGVKRSDKLLVVAGQRYVARRCMRSGLEAGARQRLGLPVGRSLWGEGGNEGWASGGELHRNASQGGSAPDDPG